MVIGKSCQKVPYETRRAALDDAKFIKAVRKRFPNKSTRNGKSGRKYRAYECPICGAWHLTTQKPLKHKNKS